MRWPWTRSAPTNRPTYTPDPEGAARGLARARARRPEVDRLVEALVRERRLNGFTASVTVVLRGDRQ